MSNINSNNAQSSKWIAVCHGMDKVILKALNFSIPGVHLGETQLGGGEYISLNVPGDHINYDPLDFDFLIDDDYSNYIQLFEWMHSIPQYEPVEDKLKTISLYLLSNYSEVSNLCIEFVNCWPTDLAVVPLDNTNDTTDLQGSVTFNFERLLMSKCCTPISEIVG